MAAKTQALAVLDAAGVPYKLLEYAAHTDHFGDHAVEDLGIDPAVTLKTLVIHHERNFAVCCVPVVGQLSLKKAAKALGWKNAEMAIPKDAQRVSGYIVGGISPLGTKQALPTLIDASLAPSPTTYVSAGRRGLSLALNPQDLARVVGASFAPISSA